MVDQVGRLLVLIEVVGQVVQAFGHGDCGNAFEQAVDHRLFAQDQRDVIAEDLHRGLELDAAGVPC